MDKTIEVNDTLQEFIITLRVPKQMSGTYTYDESKTWTMPALCVRINTKFEEYTLNHTIYLDYKDSLQTGAPIIHFDTREEAEEFAEMYGLNMEYKS